MKGSGAGALIRGAKVQDMSELYVGMLLIAETDLYGGCVNVIFVEQIRLPDHPPDDIGPPGFYGHFVNPNDPTRKRMASDGRFFVHWPKIFNEDRYYHVEHP